jgi:hypothetical protein
MDAMAKLTSMSALWTAARRDFNAFKASLLMGDCAAAADRRRMLLRSLERFTNHPSVVAGKLPRDWNRTSAQMFVTNRDFAVKCPRHAR